MRDLTQGPVTTHLLHMSIFVVVSIVAQTMYLLVDLFWVGYLGRDAIAAVAVAGNLTMVASALMRMIAAGTTILISQAAGKKDRSQAENIFNQSLALSLWIALVVGIFAFVFRNPYCDRLGANVAIATLAKNYLLWFIPALLLQFPLTSFGSALRAVGFIKPAVGFQLFSILLNIVLAPFLIFGIGPCPRLGVTGAALATFISVLSTGVLAAAYIEKKYQYFRFRIPLMAPKIENWGKMVCLGIPVGAETMLTFINFTMVYSVIRIFGPSAQAGFGAGAQLVQALLIPSVALSSAIAPVVGQNFGADRRDRVLRSIYSAMAITCIATAIPAVVARLMPNLLIRPFSNDSRVIAYGSEYMSIASLLFVAAGLVFTSSAVFQGIGDTWPPLFSSLIRCFFFVLSGLFLSRQLDFKIKFLWYLQVVSIVLQACINLLLLRRELHRKRIFESLEDTVRM